MSQPFPLTALRRRHGQMVRDSISSCKIDYVKLMKTFLNPEGHQNNITGSKVIAVFSGWGVLCLLVELHWKGCTSAACAAGLFIVRKFDFLPPSALANGSKHSVQ